MTAVSAGGVPPPHPQSRLPLRQLLLLLLVLRLPPKLILLLRASLLLLLLHGCSCYHSCDASSCHDR